MPHGDKEFVADIKVVKGNLQWKKELAQQADIKRSSVDANKISKIVTEAFYACTGVTAVLGPSVHRQGCILILVFLVDNNFRKSGLVEHLIQDKISLRQGL